MLCKRRQQAERLTPRCVTPRREHNTEYRNRVELLQDFDFNTASHRVKVTPDGEFMVATGTAARCCAACFACVAAVDLVTVVAPRAATTQQEPTRQW